MNTFLSTIGALLVISVLVTVHELGHYLAGRALGFTILEFAIGMGPVLYKTERKGIVYALRAFPIGGMCRFYGEDEEVEHDGLGFNEQKPWKRAVTVAAGPVMNVLFAFMFAVVTLLAYGDFMPQITELNSQSAPAAVAGILPGDILISVGGKTIRYYTDAIDLIGQADSQESEVVVERDGERITLVVRDFYSPEAQRNMLGVSIQAVRKSFGFFEAIGNSAAYVWALVRTMFSWFGSIFSQGLQEGDVMGPVGTIMIIGQAVRAGFETVLRMAVLISINLGVVNILPLPALDGGRLTFMALEVVRGKPISPRIEGAIHAVGLILLFGLILFLTYKDILGLIT